MRKSLYHIAIYFISIGLLVFIIQLCSLGVNNEIILPSVGNIFQSLFKLLFTSKTYIYIKNTLINLLLSLLFSSFVGMLLGLLAGISSKVRLFLKPWITILRSVPLASTLILIMVLAGLAKTPFIVCSIMLIPMIYEGFCQGVLSLDKEYMDVWKLSSKLNIKVIYKVYIPLIAPYIKTALISSIGMGIKVVIMAEYLAGVKNTLGSAIIPAANMLEYSEVYAYSILMVIVVLLLEALPKGIVKVYQYLKFSYYPKKKVY